MSWASWRFPFTLLLVALLSASDAIPAEPNPPKTVRVHAGFISGTHYLEFSNVERTAYVVGVIDGFLGSPYFHAPSKESDWLSECVSGKTNVQLEAVITKDIEADPARWHEDMSSLSYSAILRFCRSIMPK